MSGLFSTFNIGTRGLAAQQKAIDVTSHNIANANTEGYSRQRANMETTLPFNATGINTAAEAGQIGTGVQVSTIQRIRDNFLDYQIRVGTGDEGWYDQRDKYLSQIEDIVNEPSDTGLSNLMGKFFSGWSQLAGKAGDYGTRTYVAQQSLTLTNELNRQYTSLQKLKIDVQDSIKQNVFDVNGMLSQVDSLNQQIVSVRVSGQSPNDLEDKRDLLLDQLSSKFGITIDNSSFDGINVQPIVEDGAAPKDSALVKAINNKDVKTLSYIKDIKERSPGSGIYDITYYKKGDTTNSNNAVTISGVHLTQDQYKDMSECRVIWADKDGNAIDGGGKVTTDFSRMVLFKPTTGEMKGQMSVQQDIDKFTADLNRLAKGVALSVNAIHSGKIDSSDDKMPFFVNSEDGGTEDEINAGNITVNSKIIDDPMNIKTRTHDDQFDTAQQNNLDGSADGARASAIFNLKDQLIKIQNIDSGSPDQVVTRKDLFSASKGGSELNDNGLGIKSNPAGSTADNYFKDIINKLAVQEQEAQNNVKHQQSLLESYQQRKESVSGVSIDEEMANLIQYQHAYQANAKIITTVNELLDVVINGLVK